MYSRESIFDYVCFCLDIEVVLRERFFSIGSENTDVVDSGVATF